MAAQRHHQEVTGKHLLAVLLTQEGGMAPRFLEHAGVNVGALAAGVEGLLKKYRWLQAMKVLYMPDPVSPAPLPGLSRKHGI